MMKKLIPVQSFILLLAVTFLNAQNIYFTQKARIIVSAHINGKEIQLKSDELLARIDYETANFILSVDPSTFSSGIDSIDKDLMKLKGKTLKMNGKFDVDGINTKGHPPLDFSFTGELSSNNQVVTGNAHLEHIADRTYYACMLTLGFELSRENLGLNKSKYPVHNPISVKVAQAILPRSTD